MATVTLADLSQSGAGRFLFRCGYVHGNRGSGLVDGVAQRRSDVCRPNPDGIALPFFLFALPAGAVGDIVDRRKLILFTETWMAAVAIILAVVTIEGWITPWLLLALTFALSAGDESAH